MCKFQIFVILHTRSGKYLSTTTLCTFEALSGSGLKPFLTGKLSEEDVVGKVNYAEWPLLCKCSAVYCPALMVCILVSWSI